MLISNVSQVGSQKEDAVTPDILQRIETHGKKYNVSFHGSGANRAQHMDVEMKKHAIRDMIDHGLIPRVKAHMGELGKANSGPNAYLSLSRVTIDRSISL